MKCVTFPMLALSSAGGVRLAMMVANELASRGADVRVIAPSYGAQAPVEFDGVRLRVLQGCMVVHVWAP